MFDKKRKVKNVTLEAGIDPMEAVPSKARPRVIGLFDGSLW